MTGPVNLYDVPLEDDPADPAGYRDRTTQIGAALGSSKQSAWEAHNRWIEDQARQHERTGYAGLDPEQVDEAHGLAGRPD